MVESLLRDYEPTDRLTDRLFQALIDNPQSCLDLGVGILVLGVEEHGHAEVAEVGQPAGLQQPLPGAGGQPRHRAVLRVPLPRVPQLQAGQLHEKQKIFAQNSKNIYTSPATAG